MNIYSYFLILEQKLSIEQRFFSAPLFTFISLCWLFICNMLRSIVIILAPIILVFIQLIICMFISVRCESYYNICAIFALTYYKACGELQYVSFIHV